MGEMIVEQFVKSDVEMPILVSQDEAIGANETDSGTNTSIWYVRTAMTLVVKHTIYANLTHFAFLTVSGQKWKYP
jgi:hypothetical protein